MKMIDRLDTSMKEVGVVVRAEGHHYGGNSLFRVNYDEDHKKKNLAQIFW